MHYENTSRKFELTPSRRTSGGVALQTAAPVFNLSIRDYPSASAHSHSRGTIEVTVQTFLHHSGESPFSKRAFGMAKIDSVSTVSSVSVFSLKLLCGRSSSLAIYMQQARRCWTAATHGMHYKVSLWRFCVSKCWLIMLHRLGCAPCPNRKRQSRSWRCNLCPDTVHASPTKSVPFRQNHASLYTHLAMLDRQLHQCATSAAKRYRRHLDEIVHYRRSIVTVGNAISTTEPLLLADWRVDPSGEADTDSFNVRAVQRA